ncbi:MAG TPA: Yae1 family protein, partial [Ktedonobacteraceae bacterium]|nr:Yae1 family protein [Ktedonobacteraceae bacterium]
TGIFPLMVLAKDGKRPEVVEEIIQHIEADNSPSAHELLAVTYTLASLVFKKAADRNWLKRRFSMLDNHLFRDSWVYQELIEEGIEKGLQEGVEKGRQESLQAQRLTLLEIVQYRFPALTTLAQQTVDAMSDTDALRRLIVKVSVAQTEDKARQALLAVDNSKQKPH